MKSSRRRTIMTAAGALVAVTIITLAVFYAFPEKDSYSIIDPFKDRPQISVYRNLPDGLVHAGNMLVYTGKYAITTHQLAEIALPYTGYFKAARLERAICDYNAVKKGALDPGTTLLIPHSLPALMPDMRNRFKSPLIFTRGLYYTGSSAGNEKILSSIDDFTRAGINTVVFDVKDVTGIVNYNSRVPEVLDLGTSKKRTIDDIDKLIRTLKGSGIYVIARIAVFRDHTLVKQNPQYAIRSKRTGGVWNERPNEVWCDPTNREVQDYNLQIAIELAEKGVDEIQFDYIRFPTAGDLSDADFAWSFGRMTNERAIEHYLARAYKEISRRNVNFSIDVFGVVAWGHEKDIEKTGQRIELLSKYCDVISPMLYPSHFNNNFDGHPNPGDAPYYFIYTGCLKFRERAGKTPIRPWLQAFGWRVSNYNPGYIREQIRASNDAQSVGYLFWNAANSYDTVIEALKEINSESLIKKEREIGRIEHANDRRAPL
jgi:hypothetical protein